MKIFLFSLMFDLVRSEFILSKNMNSIKYFFKIFYHSCLNFSDSNVVRVSSGIQTMVACIRVAMSQNP